jgi:hypothetical protein
LGDFSRYRRWRGGEWYLIEPDTDPRFWSRRNEYQNCRVIGNEWWPSSMIEPQAEREQVEPRIESQAQDLF